MRRSMPCTLRPITYALSTLAALFTFTAMGAATAGAQAVQTPAGQPKPAVGAGQKPTPGPVASKATDPKRPSSVQTLNDEDIVVSPGDVIQIQVENHPSLDSNYVIPGVGKLLLPEAGEVQIAGYTIVQIRDRLQAALEKTLNNVYVRVLLKEVHSRSAAITGAVLHQIRLDMGTSKYKVLDLIDAAGGLSAPVYRENTTISEYGASLYRGRAVLPVDLAEATTHPDGPMNYDIQPGDRLVITLLPIVTHEVHILGQIPRQGAYPLDNNTTVLTLFGRAGYPSTTASLSTAYVLRNVDKLPLDLRPLLTGNPDQAVNKFKFQDGDILYIPEVKAQFLVWGAVARQGNFPYPEAAHIKLLEAIVAAGGESGTGEFRTVHLIRTTDGKQTDKTINVDKMIHKGIMQENIELKPGDIVWVPPKHVRYTPGIQDVFVPLSLMNFLGIHPFF